MHADPKHTIRTSQFLILAGTICLFGAAISQAQILPDLTVTDIWESNGQVHFTIKNSGTMTAATGQRRPRRSRARESATGRAVSTCGSSSASAS